MKAAAVVAQSLTVNGDRQTEQGGTTDFTGPAYIAMTPGQTSFFQVEANVLRDTVLYRANNLKICSINLLTLTHKDSTKQALIDRDWGTSHSLQPGQMVYQHPDTTAERSATLTTTWTPSPEYVHDGALPYYATYQVSVDEIGGTCQSPLLGWPDKVTIKIPIYITMGDIPPKETKSLKFSGDLTVTNNVTFGIKPEFDIAAHIRNFQLQDATLAVNADIEFQNELLIQGNAGATLDKTLELLAPRKFVRVFTAGPVPIVVSGEFGINLRVQGTAAGTVNLTEVLRYAFPQTRFGLVYQNGQWKEITNFQPEYSFRIGGDGEAGAELTLTLVPDLQLHFYDAVSGRMLVEPYLYAHANIHGNFLYQDASGQPLPYTQLPDYWFTTLEGGGGLDVKLYAGLHIFDYNIASYPPNVTVDQTDQFKKIAVIPKTPIAAIPTLSAAVDYLQKPKAGSDTRAVLVTGKATDLANPFKGWLGTNPDPFANPFIQFAKWTDPQVFSDQAVKKIAVASDVGSDAFWMNYATPGTYCVRLSGESDLGWFVRLVAEDKSQCSDKGGGISAEITLTDNDHDGMVDQWETQWGVDDPAADPDGDLVSNLDEFKVGTDPMTADQGSRIEVSVSGPGTVNSNPTGTLGGITNCGTSTGICRDGFNLPNGAMVTLTATAGSGSTFLGWSGVDANRCQEGINQTLCTLNSVGLPINISATFSELFNPWVGTFSNGVGEAFAIGYDGTVIFNESAQSQINSCAGSLYAFMPPYSITDIGISPIFNNTCRYIVATWRNCQTNTIHDEPFLGVCYYGDPVIYLISSYLNSPTKYIQNPKFEQFNPYFHKIAP